MAARLDRLLSVPGRLDGVSVAHTTHCTRYTTVPNKHSVFGGGPHVFFFQETPNSARRRRARLVAVAWIRVGVEVRVRGGLGRRGVRR